MPNTQDSIHDKLDQIPDIDTITAALLFLLSKRSAEPNLSLSMAIIDHLKLLENHPACKPGVLQNATRRLRFYWNELRESEKQHANQSPGAADLTPLDQLH
jgi:hypothetical protein